MYCAFCGKQIADDDVFCRYCGKPAPQRDALAGLVAAARTGDQNAISVLYEKTYSKVYYTVKSMIKDEDEVFDIVQDTYIKAFAHLDSFQGDTKFLPWVRQIAANTARDWLKKKRPMLFAELNSGDEQDTPVEELFPDERSDNLPDQVIDQKETTRLIREIIEELPEDQRAAIGMFYYEEMSVKEIAAAMDASESAVKSRLKYGRDKIEKKVLELEKQGTKLYSLAPLPFLLLLFRNQKVYAAEAPNSQILHDILASRPMGVGTVGAGAAQGAGTVGAGAAQGAGTVGAGAAQGTGTVGAVAGTETAGAATAGAAAAGTATAATVAAAGGLGALKIGLISLAALAVVGLGVFGAVRLASGPAEPQEPATNEDVIGQRESETPEESEAPEESEIPEEISYVDEALEQYRIIIGQADSYDYGTPIPDLETVGYRYALVQMQPDDPVPTLLLEKEEGGWTFTTSTLVFQYDPDTKTVLQPAEVIGGGIRGGLSMAGDGYGIFDQYWSGGTGEGAVTRITLEGDSLKRDTCWTGRIDLMPDSITFIEIEWHEIGDLSALDKWTAIDKPAEEETGVSYIFSRMPVAVYEVTGLGVGLNEEVYAEHVIDPESGEDVGVVPFVKLDSSNTFVLFCLMSDIEVDEFGEYIKYDSTAIHSPSGSSQWEANYYRGSISYYPEIEGYASGDPSLSKWDSEHYNEETYSGSIYSLVDPWMDYLEFAEIYHPDALQEDTIHVIEMDSMYYDENYDEVGEMLAVTVSIFEKIGATNVREISVEEALKKYHIVVSEEGAD